MLFSPNLIEIFPLYIINILFFLAFFFVLSLSYPTGRYFLKNYCENSLIKCSLFSIIVFATIVSITINLAPFFAKYVIFIFYIINLITFAANLKIRKDFINALISFKSILLFIFVVFLVINEIFKPIYIENGNLVYFFDGHDPYYFDPIAEILTSDYFTRVKVFSVYPLEWSAYHFFESSFNSIFLLLIYQSGTIGLIILKHFYFSIFIVLFFLGFFNGKSLKDEKLLQTLLKGFFVILIFISLFFPKVIYFILAKNFISTLSILFIVQSLFSKNKNEFLIWVIIFSLTSFRNVFISLMLVVYYLIESEHINFETIIHKIKKSLNWPNLILAILFLLYFIATFYQNETFSSKFHLLGSKNWWSTTTTYAVLDNYKYFISIFIILIIIYSVLLKYFFKEKLYFFSYFEKKDFFYFILVLVIPVVCAIISIFKNQIIEIYTLEKLKIFFDSFNLKNLSYYFFVPLIWFFILFCCKILVRNVFLITIIIYTFLSIFIYNSISMPAFFALEIMILYYVSSILLNSDRNSKKKTLCYLFMTSVVISCFVNPNIYYESFVKQNYQGSIKLTFKIKDLKELKKSKYLCPHHTKNIGSNKYIGAALSGILVKPYYSDISIHDKESHWYNIPLRFAVKSNEQVNNPCKNE